jgi:hypothetical protein
MFDVSGLNVSRLLGPLAESEDRLARLDTTLKSSPIQDGWIARSHYLDAIASLALEGELVHLEDLVLADAEMAIRTPTHELVRAQHYLDTRRQIADRESGWSLSRAALKTLRSRGGDEDNAEMPAEEGASSVFGRQSETDEDASLDDAFAAIDNALANTRSALAGEIKQRPSRDEGLNGAGRLEEDRLETWRNRLEQSTSLPPTLVAAIALDDWDTSPLLPNQPWLGRLIIASMLRQRAKTTTHLACLSVGIRALPMRQRQTSDPTERIISYLRAITAAGDLGLGDHSRWLTARAGLLRRLAGRRSSSRLPELVDLVMRRPIVSAGMITAELDISSRAALQMVEELGLRETTGRGRYRAWGVL